MTFDTLAGLYVYCMDYHSGQWSRLYRIMSKINMDLRDHHANMIRNGKLDPNHEWANARRVYRKLKRNQAQ